MVAAVASMLLLLLAACGDADDSAAAPAAAPTPTALPIVAVAAADDGVDTVALPAAADAGAAGATVAAQLSAVDIVAAHEQVLGRVYEEAINSIVYVKVVHRLDPEDAQFGRDFFGGGFPFDEYSHGAGSGFVWDERGHILTNWHVVEGSDSVTVFFADGQEYAAEWLGGDPDSDLAILKIEAGDRQLRPLPRGNSGELHVGQMALAIGSPFGQDFTLTSGIVSAVGRTISSRNSNYSIPLVVQTDAPINPGNSGGPLLDRHGRVIGINTQIITDSGVNSGVGFAVPIDIAKKVAPELIAHGKYTYAWLGISGSSLTRDAADAMDLPEGSRGVLVVTVLDDSPAAQAGLRGGDDRTTIDGEDYVLGGDVIIAINGEPVREMHDLISYLVQHTRPDDEATLSVLRSGGDTATLSVTLGTRPSSE